MISIPDLIDLVKTAVPDAEVNALNPAMKDGRIHAAEIKTATP